MRLAGPLAALVLSLPALATAASPSSRVVHSRGNPIIADDSFYSADPAPIAVATRCSSSRGGTRRLPT